MNKFILVKEYQVNSFPKMISTEQNKPALNPEPSENCSPSKRVNGETLTRVCKPLNYKHN